MTCAVCSLDKQPPPELPYGHDVCSDYCDITYEHASPERLLELPWPQP